MSYKFKKYYLLAFLSSVSSYALAQDIPQYKILQSNIDFSTQFISWHTKGTDSRGYQFYSPFQMTTKLSKVDNQNIEIDLGLKSGFINSGNTTSGASGYVSSITDTVLQTQISYKGFGAFQPFVTIAMNLPTGTATLSGDRHRAVMDKDLVFLTRFGEGLNFNPGAGFAYAFSEFLVASMGLGFNFRGDYIPNGDSGLTLSSGNQTIGNFGLTWKNKTSSIGWTTTITTEKDTYQDGAPNFKAGNSYSFGLNLSHAWNNRHSTNLNGNIVYTDKNKSYDFWSDSYTLEQKNSNSTVYVASLQHNYQLNDMWSVYGRATYLMRDKNLYDSISDQYSPRKTKISGELGLNKAVNQKVSINASLGLFNLNQDETPYADKLKTVGVQGSLGVRVGF